MNRLPILTLAVLVIFVACILHSKPADAFKSYRKSPVVNLCRNLSLASGATFTSAPYDIGESETHGISWDINGTANLGMEVLQSNYSGGGYTKWAATTLAGLTVNNSLTAVTTRDGTNLKLAPSDKAQTKITNMHSATVNVTVDMFLQ